MRDDSAAYDKTPGDGAEYIERMARELSHLATSAGLAFLAYILEMAAEEASSNRMTSTFRADGAIGTGLSQDKT